MTRPWKMEILDKMPEGGERGSPRESDTQEIIAEAKKAQGRVLKIQCTSKPEMSRLWLRIRYHVSKKNIKASKVMRQGTAIYIDCRVN